jgi:hypothetical protein
MKKAIYTPAQVDTIKSITPFDFIGVHGNTKKIKGLPTADYKQIVNKKRERLTRSKTAAPAVSNARKVRELIVHMKNAVNTPYFKAMIEGNTGIYLASPTHGHRDYNRSLIFDKTPHNVKLMKIYNNLFSNLPADEENGICLLEDYENMPPAVQAIFEKYETLDGLSYTQCEELLSQCEAIGYTFEYGLSAEPINLRPIGTQPKY